MFVIGGEQLYQQAMTVAEKLYLTEIEEALDGDAFFPPVAPEDWEEVFRKSQQEASGLTFSFVEYCRRKRV